MPWGIKRNWKSDQGLRRCGFRGEVEIDSANQRLGQPSYFSNWPENTNLAEDVEILLSVSFLEFRSAASSEKLKLTEPIRGWDGYLSAARKKPKNGKKR